MPTKPQFRFEKLTVWQSARRLSGEIYTATQAFPRDELLGLTAEVSAQLTALNRTLRVERSKTPFPRLAPA